jgi:hypothetical protein
MHKKYDTGILFVSLIFVFLLPAYSAAADSVFRLAVVDVGTTEKIPKEFLDLLLVSFKRHPEIAILERTDVDRILKEQSLNLSFSDSNVLQPGRIKATDAFLLLESNKLEKTEYLRIRLVDTRYGLKCWDTLIPFPSEKNRNDKPAEKLAEATSLKIRNIYIVSGDPIPLGVSAIRSEELSPRWDWLSDTLATGIEQNLALYPGVILMERFKTGPLREERNLVEGLPEALRPSAVFIDGSYKINRTEGRETASLYLRCRRQQRVLLETHMEGPVDDPGGLYMKAVTSILAGLMNNAKAAPMNPAFEADMLANEARLYLTIKDPERALPLAEAALALTPDSLENRRLFVEASKSFMYDCSRKLLSNTNQLSPFNIVKTILDTGSKAFPVAEYLIRNLTSRNRNPPLPAERANINYAVVNFLSAIKDWHSNELPKSLKLGQREKEAMADLRRNFWSLYHLSVETFKRDNDPYLKQILFVGERSFSLCESLDCAIEHSRDLAINHGRETAELVSCLIRPTYAEWPKEKDAAKRIEENLKVLTQAESALTRMQAEQASIYFYSYYRQDYVKARAHCENLVRLMKSNNFFVQTNNSYEYIRQILSRRFSASSAEDASIKAEYMHDLVEHALASGSIRNVVYRSPGIPEEGYAYLNMEFGEAVKYVVQQQERDNRVEEANALLERAMDEVQIDSIDMELKALQRQLQSKHPGLTVKNAAPESPGLQARQIFKMEGMKDKRTYLQRLVSNGTDAAIIYPDVNSIQSRRYGVIRLSSETLKPTSIKLLPFDIRFERKAADFAYELEYTRKGPSVAVDSRGVYIGFYQGGIVIHPNEGQDRNLTENNGLASEYVRALEVLDGKLYALVGAEKGESGLMEVDPETGQSKILFSSKTKNPGMEPDGKPISGIAADSGRHALWILSALPNNRNALYLYYPHKPETVWIQNRAIAQVLWNRQIADQYSVLNKINDHLLIDGVPNAIHVDLSAETATMLFSMMNAQREISKWNYTHLLTTGNRPIRYIPVNNDLIGITASELIYFHDGNREPEYFSANILPGYGPGSSLQDIAMTDKGLLVLTNDALYLIQKIIEKRRPEKSPAFSQKIPIQSPGISSSDTKVK